MVKRTISIVTYNYVLEEFAITEMEMLTWFNWWYGHDSAVSENWILLGPL